jgi:hydroxymethylpyrimidine pyrophosphatase-like HAD family hydrolase
VLIASDLDRTLIYSRAACALAVDDGSELTCVEMYEGRPTSFMTKAAAGRLDELGGAVLPVTTRTTAQLARVRLPGRGSRFAVAGNGGVLLVDGEIDAAWSARVARELARVAGQAEIWRHLTMVCAPEWTMSLRNADDLFCYAVVDRSALPAAFLGEITEWAAQRGWSTSLQGRKLYWVPRTLTKSAAVAEVAERLRADAIVAAGDSLLDIDLLEAADVGIHPAHGEIAESGWRAAHVRSTQAVGVRAGEEICAWFGEQLRLFGPVDDVGPVASALHEV